MDTPDPALTLPPHIKAAITVYVISDATGFDAAVKVGGMSAIPGSEFDPDGMTATVCDHLNQLAGCNDARPMTAEEVAEYLRDEAGEGSEDDDDE